MNLALSWLRNLNNCGVAPGRARIQPRLAKAHRTTQTLDSCAGRGGGPAACWREHAQPAHAQLAPAAACRGASWVGVTRSTLPRRRGSIRQAADRSRLPPLLPMCDDGCSTVLLRLPSARELNVPLLGMPFCGFCGSVGRWVGGRWVCGFWGSVAVVLTVPAHSRAACLVLGLLLASFKPHTCMIYPRKDPFNSHFPFFSPPSYFCASALPSACCSCFLERKGSAARRYRT